eukprot:TRINITY_DN1028_c0_g1_i6.p1 TRINITY_DN1028_c0_g1~~TRINITY_DN1028_c0_g1_i6.p1  ORF type:complete len:205 (+),score=42.05 TRINITY_DN1028_c0_g1_i6:69-617(+)
MWAAMKGHVDCVTALLAHDAEVQVTAVDGRGRTALMWAARHGHVGCVAALLAHDAEVQVTAVDGRRRTALMWAASTGHVDCVAALLQHRAAEQVAAVDREGSTAFRLAVLGSHKSVIAKLMRAGADIGLPAEYKVVRDMITDMCEFIDIPDRLNELVVAFAQRALQLRAPGPPQPAVHGASL